MRGTKTLSLSSTLRSDTTQPSARSYTDTLANFSNKSPAKELTMMNDSPNSPTPSPSETSPLGTAPTDIDSITELFSREDTTWTDGDIDRMIEHLREMRSKLGEGQKPAKAEKAPKVQTEKVSAEDLLARLGLGS